MIYTSSYSCWCVVSDDVTLEAVTFAVIAVLIGQYCLWIGFWSALQHVKACRGTRATPANWPVVENFYYSLHSCRILVVSYSNTLQYTDLNDVLTICGQCVLHLLWWHKLWVWMRRDFQLIFTSYRTNKTKKAKKSLRPQRVKVGSSLFWSDLELCNFADHKLIARLMATTHHNNLYYRHLHLHHWLNFISSSAESARRILYLAASSSVWGSSEN
jgi:hypothetical protein